MALVRAAVPRYCIRDHLGELRRFSEAQDEGTERRQQNQKVVERHHGTRPERRVSEEQRCPAGELALRAVWQLARCSHRAWLYASSQTSL